MAEPDVSTLRVNETLVLFPTAARLSDDGRSWRVPLHAWVYVPQQSRVRTAAIAKLLEERYGLRVDATSRPYFERRINLLLADNKHGRVIVVEAAGRTFRLPPTRHNGHAGIEVEIPRETAEGAAPEGRLPVRVVLPPRDGRSFTGVVHLIGPSGLSIVSDIDDTVKVTHVTDRAKLWDHTFYKPFEAVPGMAELYKRLLPEGAGLHFVSSSPWHLYAPLAEFLEQSGFPPATLELKTIRLKDASVLNILKSPLETKPPQIEALMARHPGRRFILVGDSGEKDPEIYADFMRRYPGRIERILIRNVTGASADDARFKAIFEGLDPRRWQLFVEPREIPLAR